jgi:hypothetical protein
VSGETVRPDRGRRNADGTLARRGHSDFETCVYVDRGDLDLTPAGSYCLASHFDTILHAPKCERPQRLELDLEAGRMEPVGDQRLA